MSWLEGADRSRPRSDRDVVVAEDGDREPTSLTGVADESHVCVAAHGTDRTPGGCLLPGSGVRALAATPPALRREADGDGVRRLADR